MAVGPDEALRLDNLEKEQAEKSLKEYAQKKGSTALDPVVASTLLDELKQKEVYQEAVAKISAEIGTPIDDPNKAQELAKMWKNNSAIVDTLNIHSLEAAQNYTNEHNKYKAILELFPETAINDTSNAQHYVSDCQTNLEYFVAMKKGLERSFSDATHLQNYLRTMKNKSEQIDNNRKFVDVVNKQTGVIFTTPDSLEEHLKNLNKERGELVDCANLLIKQNDVVDKLVNKTQQLESDINLKNNELNKAQQNASGCKYFVDEIVAATGEKFKQYNDIPDYIRNQKMNIGECEKLTKVIIEETNVSNPEGLKQYLYNLKTSWDTESKQHSYWENLTNAAARMLMQIHNSAHKSQLNENDMRIAFTYYDELLSKAKAEGHTYIAKICENADLEHHPNHPNYDKCLHLQKVDGTAFNFGLSTTITTE